MHGEKQVAVGRYGPIFFCGEQFHFVHDLAKICHCDEHFIVIATSAFDVFTERVCFLKRVF